MADRIVGLADRICVAVHFLAWCAAAITWGVKWSQEGPAPAGPLYYAAQKFISQMDVLVSGGVHELTVKIAPVASAWFSWDGGASLTIIFACLIFLAGTVQWFLLGRLVQWVAARKGRVAALSILGVYGAWVAGALFLWVAS
jgi:hypothetical protein